MKLASTRRLSGDLRETRVETRRRNNLDNIDISPRYRAFSPSPVFPLQGPRASVVAACPPAPFFPIKSRFLHYPALCSCLWKGNQDFFSGTSQCNRSEESLWSGNETIVGAFQEKPSRAGDVDNTVAARCSCSSSPIDSFCTHLPAPITFNPLNRHNFASPQSPPLSH